VRAFISVGIAELKDQLLAMAALSSKRSSPPWTPSAARQGLCKYVKQNERAMTPPSAIWTRWPMNSWQGAAMAIDLRFIVASSRSTVT